jgi:hypothetical protein
MKGVFSDVQGSAEAISNGGFGHRLGTKEPPHGPNGLVKPPLVFTASQVFFFSFFFFLNKKFN